MCFRMIVSGKSVCKSKKSDGKMQVFRHFFSRFLLFNLFTFLLFYLFRTFVTT